MNDKFANIKAIVDKVNPKSERTKELINKFLRMYSEMK